ncbi:MAG: DUF2779 domain-containing protein [Candidatus Wallbacteria bacterium]|nr:DUF2779 domain-containing protein [Candidatus Wallbacteria bacterium]
MDSTHCHQHYHLSKSKYIAWLQCPKRLWLQVHRPDLLEQAVMPHEVEIGYQVGDLARDLFPGGALVEFKGHDIGEQLKLTAELIKNGTQVIYEAAFSHEGLFCKTDLLVKKRGGYELYEVKASTGIKDYYYHDLPGHGTVIAYNSSFEATRLKELAAAFPEHKERIERVIASIVNLETPFRKRWAYDWKQCGSYSIKEVLPAFVPGMTYEGLEIGNGDQAMNAYASMPDMPPEEAARTRKALLIYCGQDTLAMVKLWEKLREMCA